MLDFPCSAIVLAGGRATRLGGIDKALVPLAGRPLLAHVLEHLAPQVDDIVINCNRNEDAMASFGHPLIGDQLADYAGPLAGIAAALPYCRHDTVLVVPCDTPFLPRDLRTQLAAALKPDTDLVITHDGKRLQPLFMLLRRRLAESLNDYLAAGERKVEIWCMRQKTAIARYENPGAFINLNTPEELQEAEKKMGDGTASAF